MFSTVEEYSGLGDHRTGTPVDQVTIEWFADRCRGLGASVVVEPWSFDRYEASWEMTVDGVPVEAIPLFYEGVGSVATDTPFLSDIDVVGAAAVADLGDVVACARAAAVPLAVIGTRSPTGRLFALNRAPTLGSGLPMLCVAPDVPDGRLSASLSASIVRGSSANVVARFGSHSADGALVVGTPLSGWFRCAGERGSGIAVALEVCRRVSATRPVVLVGTSGHELHNLGHHELGSLGTVSSVIHVGASAAAHGRTRGVLSEWVRLAVAGAPAAAEALASIGHDVVVATPQEAADPAWWRGEAADWSRLGVPLLSIAGMSPLFHSPADLPDAATTQELLDTVADAVTEAALLLP